MAQLPPAGGFSRDSRPGRRFGGLRRFIRSSAPSPRDRHEARPAAWAPAGRHATAPPLCKATSSLFRLPPRVGQGQPHTQARDERGGEIPFSSCRPPAGLPRSCCRQLLLPGGAAGGSSRGAGGVALGGRYPLSKSLTVRLAPASTSDTAPQAPAAPKMSQKSKSRARFRSRFWSGCFHFGIDLGSVWGPQIRLRSLLLESLFRYRKNGSSTGSASCRARA